MKRRIFIRNIGLTAATGGLFPKYIFSQNTDNLFKNKNIDPTNGTPKVIDTLFNTDDILIASYNVADFGAKGDGKIDDTYSIQKAIDAAWKEGGGVVFLPAGDYVVRGRIEVLPGVMLRGDWKNPERIHDGNQDGNGTVLMAFADKGKSKGAAFIGILNNAGIKDLTIWYPEQQLDNIEPYPFTLRQVGKYSATIENVTLVNSYQGIEIGPESNSLAMLKNIYATALKTGLVRDNTWDVARMQNLQFSPRFWIQSNFPGAPVSSKDRKILTGFMETNGEAVIIRFPAWTWFYNLTIEHYKTGVLTLPSMMHKMKGPNGGIYNLQLSNCHTGIHLGDNAAAGFFVTGGVIHTKGKSSVGILADTTFNSTAQFNSIKLTGSSLVAVKMNESEKGALTFIHTQFDVKGSKGFTIDISGGIIEVLQSQFSQYTNHIRLGDKTKMAYIDGNTFPGSPDIRNKMPEDGDFTILHNPLNLAKPSVDDFEWKKNTPLPSSKVLLNIKDYGASGNGLENDAPAIQKALEHASGTGGTVFVPPGSYLLTNELIIPPGVELRGASDGPHHTIERTGAEFIVQAGKNKVDGIPLIRLEKNSGIRGLTIFYPDQVWNTTEYIPYPWTIQGLGPGVWIKDVVLVNSYNGVDFATFNSQNHVIDYLSGSPLVTGLYVGNNAGKGWVQNVQFIPHYWARSTYKNKPEKGETLRANTQKSLTGIEFGFNHQENMLHNFVYGAHFGIRYGSQDDLGGTNGISLAQGVDGSEIALKIDEGNELQFINTQLVALGESNNKRTILISNKFSGIARFFNTIFWGQPERSVEIQGGKVLFQQTNHTAKQGDAAFYITGGETQLVANRFIDPGLNIFVGSGALVKVTGAITQSKNSNAHIQFESLPSSDN